MTRQVSASSSVIGDLVIAGDVEVAARVVPFFFLFCLPFSCLVAAVIAAAGVVNNSLAYTIHRLSF